MKEADQHIKKTLELLDLALTGYNHTWTNIQRKSYEKALYICKLRLNIKQEKDKKNECQL